ncbi:helix-turn-helix domain-containing protein [Streptomyces sp. SAS_272]|uniref:helix-turn-helix domain-containing protein n=1 Tax=Streptomyces sp. SAS_272 TaxID=3412747 RepID=UPI00403CC10C
MHSGCFHPTDAWAAAPSHTFGCVRMVYHLALAALAEAWARQELVNFSVTSDTMCSRPLPEGAERAIVARRRTRLARTPRPSGPSRMRAGASSAPCRSEGPPGVDGKWAPRTASSPPPGWCSLVPPHTADGRHRAPR